MENYKLTLWEIVQIGLLIMFLSIGFINTTYFCINLIGNTYRYVISLTTYDEVTNIVDKKQNSFILEIEKLRYECEQEGNYFGVSTSNNMFGYEEIVCTSNKKDLQ